MKKSLRSIISLALALIIGLCLNSAFSEAIDPPDGLNLEGRTEDYAIALAGIYPGDVLIVSEKLFLTQIYDMYFNHESYVDKAIQIEGMFNTLGYISQNADPANNPDAPASDDPTPMLYRQSPGCCGNDGYDGFVLKYDGPLPQPQDWIRAIGKVKYGTQEGVDPYMGIYLEVISLRVLNNRGLEFVAQ